MKFSHYQQNIAATMPSADRKTDNSWFKFSAFLSHTVALIGSILNRCSRVNEMWEVNQVTITDRYFLRIIRGLPPSTTQLGAISPLRICISEVMRLGGRPSTTSIKIHVGGCSESWRRVGWGEMIYERGEYGVISVPTLWLRNALFGNKSLASIVSQGQKGCLLGLLTRRGLVTQDSFEEQG